MFKEPHGGSVTSVLMTVGREVAATHQQEGAALLGQARASLVYLRDRIDQFEAPFNSGQITRDARSEVIFGRSKRHCNSRTKGAQFGVQKGQICHRCK